MANQFTTLPAPAANGSGAAVDVSTFGGLKTVTVAPTSFSLKPTVIIEFSNELVPTKFAPIVSLLSGERSMVIAARWMRATVKNYRGGGAPVINLGGDDTGASFATLIAPAGSGNGAGVDVSALPDLKTIHIADPFRGALNIEISEDGGVTYQTLTTFYGPGYKTLEFAARFMRASRVGVPGNSPGLPLINVGAVLGGGDSGLVIEDEGVAIATADTLNFVGAGVTATDAGGGQVNVTIPGSTGGNPQRFSYTVLGTEPDLANLVIPLPAVRANALYKVQVTMGTFTFLLGVAVPVASRAVNQFILSLGAVATAGDTFDFVVTDPT